MTKGILFVLAALPASVLAFFDGFDGSSLGSHWDFFSEGSGWTHQVTDGELRVTALSGPFEFDEVGIIAFVGPFSDFAAEARVMWDVGAFQTLSFGISQEFPFMNPRIATMRYVVSPGNAATVSATLNTGGAGSIGAPPPGEWHLFRIVRAGASLEAFVDGALLASTQTSVPDSADRVFLHFGGPDTDQFGEFRVDFVSVVPEPFGCFALGAGAFALLLKKQIGRRDDRARM